MISKVKTELAARRLSLVEAQRRAKFDGDDPRWRKITRELQQVEARIKRLSVLRFSKQRTRAAIESR